MNKRNKKIYSQLDFDKALQTIVSEELRGNNPVPDLLSFLHLRHLYGSDFQKKLNILLEQYIEKREVPKPLLKMDVPKMNFTIRPMARPTTEDWLLYESIIDYIAKAILKKNKKICNRSFSIIHCKKKTFKRTNAWLEFDNKSREFYRKNYTFVVTTDITGYYENISLSELRKRINDYLVDDDYGLKLTEVLFIFLKKWSDERISGYGLPQGPPNSAFLADIYLDLIDRKMEKYKGYIRYMDDIRIFCKTDIEAKLSLKDLTISLRELKLNINAKKTDILFKKEIEESLFDPYKPLLDTIEKVIYSEGRKLIENSAVPSLTSLIEAAFSMNDPFEKRHLNFALYRLGILYSSGIDVHHRKIIKNIIENFKLKPHHAGLFSNFLTLFPDEKSIPKNLISFLKSKNNIYEWQELKVLQCILRCNFKASQTDIDFFLSSAQDSNKNFVIRAFYFLLVGKYGSNRDRNLIISCYENLPNIYIKKGIILSVQELGIPTRNGFYSRIKTNENDKDISQFIEYVKSLSRPIYFLTTERPKIETLEKDGYENILYDFI